MFELWFFSNLPLKAKNKSIDQMHRWVCPFKNVKIVLCCTHLTARNKILSSMKTWPLWTLILANFYEIFYMKPDRQIRIANLIIINFIQIFITNNLWKKKKKIKNVYLANADFQSSCTTSNTENNWPQSHRNSITICSCFCYTKNKKKNWKANLHFCCCVLLY